MVLPSGFRYNHFGSFAMKFPPEGGIAQTEFDAVHAGMTTLDLTVASFNAHDPLQF